MKTKFILHGGFNADIKKQENDLFFSEILNTAPQVSKVLLVYFASNPDNLERYQADDTEQFDKNRRDKTLSFEIANETDFENQVKSADVVYFRGGKTSKILETLKNFPELKNLLKGKIMASDSAGTNSLCSVFYSASMGVGEGLGIVPIKVVCHCTDENKNKLDSVRPDLETVCLPEYQFRIFEV